MAEPEKIEEEVRPPELENHYPIETDEPEPSRNYLMLAALAVAALAFATLVVLGGRWAYDHWHKKPATSTTGSQQRPTFQTESTGKSSQSQNNKQTSGSGGSSKQGSSSSGATATQLPNNGPGNVIALFLGSSALASVLHYKLSNRRRSESRR